MPRHLDDTDWTVLLSRIKAGKCTPFVGAGACFGSLPLGRDIAFEWAEEYDYPLADVGDLARVAQFLATRFDPMFPKERIVERLSGAAAPDFARPTEPHALLAELPLPLYLTTNYDDFLMQALQRDRAPTRELCRWNTLVSGQPSPLSETDPTVPNPVVFHLHGHIGVPESLVLTEDDYLDFLVNTSLDQELIPPRVQAALAGASLLFVGYSLEDWSFRVLFRGLVGSVEKSLRRTSVTVQLPPPEAKDEVFLKDGSLVRGRIVALEDGVVRLDSESLGEVRIEEAFVEKVRDEEEITSEDISKQEEYLSRYFELQEMRVYWGTADEFTEELRTKWDDFQGKS